MQKKSYDELGTDNTYDYELVGHAARATATAVHTLVSWSLRCIDENSASTLPGARTTGRTHTAPGHRSITRRWTKSLLVEVEYGPDAVMA